MGFEAEKHDDQRNGHQCCQGRRGRTLDLSYSGGGEKKISIPDGTPIVTFGPATEADLKPGATVFVPAQRGDDGALATGFVVVARTASTRRCRLSSRLTGAGGEGGVGQHRSAPKPSADFVAPCREAPQRRHEIAEAVRPDLGRPFRLNFKQRRVDHFDDPPGPGVR